MHENSGKCLTPGAVLFDMDGVLTDNLRFHHAAWAACLHERFGVALADEDRRFHVGLTHEILERVLGRAQPPEEARVFHAFREERYRDLARGRLAPVRGLREYLERLAALGVPVALVTGSDRQSVAFVLGELGLSGSFPVAVTGDDVRRGKPAPDAYLLAAAQLGVAPADCLVHEDSEGGVVSAVTAGAVVAGVTTSLAAPALLAAGALWAGPDFAAWLSHLERRAGASPKPARQVL